jgi:hypothetical protein
LTVALNDGVGLTIVDCDGAAVPAGAPAAPAASTTTGICLDGTVIVVAMLGTTDLNVEIAARASVPRHTVSGAPIQAIGFDNAGIGKPVRIDLDVAPSLASSAADTPVTAVRIPRD